MADHLLASAETIRKELLQLEARRDRLKRLLKIAEADEAAATTAPAAEPEKPAEAAKDELTPAKVDVFTSRKAK